MIRVLIADDHHLVRQGIKQLLAETGDIEVAAETATGAETLECVNQNTFDVVVLDISMPKQDGLEVLKQIRKNKPEVAVLILTMYSADQYAVRMFKAGASGYLTKESLPDELCTAIRTLAAGRRYVNREVGELLAAQCDCGDTPCHHDNLSDREYQVLRMLGSGKKIKEIAAELALSTKTVSTYQARILDKLNLQNQLELVRYSVENRLVSSVPPGTTSSLR